MVKRYNTSWHNCNWYI